MSEQDDPYDNALADEEEGHQAINQGQGAPGSIPQHAEDRVSPADREMDGMESEAGTDFPARVNVTIEKPGGGALLVQTVVQNGYFQIEDLSYFAKPDLAHAQTAEKDWARQALYAGPPFENLDEALQGMLDRYLEDRGIHSELATMIPDYIQVKEQKEYVSWLESK
jgi:complement component 1 Q subcomponent-binding protein